ncbi:MAG: alpha-ribazole phosphatase family protein [Sedimenticolaceae bacterium]
MSLLGLLRHGEVQGGECFRGHTDDPLTDIGLEQMKAATNGDYHWDRVITSPLERCASFARTFAMQHSLPLTFDDRLKEMYFGTWEGCTASEIIDEDPNLLTKFWTDPDKHSPPYGEPLSIFQARVLDAWNNVLYYHAGQRVLIVTHGGVIRVVLCHVQQRPVGKLLEIEVKHGALYTMRVSVDAKQIPIAELITQV